MCEKNSDESAKNYSFTLRKRNALLITDTLLKLMAAAAMMGLREQSELGIENACGDGHSDWVVDEREEEVLLDVAHDGVAEAARPHQARRSPLSSVMPALSMRDVGTGRHGDANVGLRQRRSVVDAVARHRDRAFPAAAAS